jgi:hypothetical protein
LSWVNAQPSVDVNIAKSKITGSVKTGREISGSSVGVVDGVDVAVLVLTSEGGFVVVSVGISGVVVSGSGVNTSCHGKLQACNMITSSIRVKILIDFFLIFASNDVKPEYY